MKKEGLFKRTIQVFYVLLLFTSAQAQDSTKNKIQWPQWSIEGSYHLQSSQAVELGFNLTWYLYGSENLRETGIYVSSEYHFLPGRNIFAPKIGIGLDECFYDLKGWGYTSKLNVLWMDPGKNDSFCFLPQAGITWAGIFNLYYGYNIPFRGENINGISGHRFSVTFNIGYVRSIINIMDVSGGM